MMIRRGTILAVAALVVACVGDDSVISSDGGDGGEAGGVGSVGEACFGNGTCDTGLTCVSSVCVNLDSGTSDVSSPDAPTHDAADDAPIATTYATLNDLSKWSSFDTTTFSATACGYLGAAFDGRYVYYVPFGNTLFGNGDGVVVRYDTHAPFGATPSYSLFDMSVLSADAIAFQGAVFDGRYLYFVPTSHTDHSAVVPRYDTTAPFDMTTSWSTFDVSTVNANANGFQGGTFDGRYVYFTPDNNQTGADGVVARYDTKGSFAMSNAWSTFDASTASSGAKGFYGSVFDGRYVYFVPNDDGGSTGLVVRYDSQASFTSTTSWTTFDAASVDTNAVGFDGAVFDGRYVYFVPFGGLSGSQFGLMIRYDTQAPFGTMGSWTTFDLTTVNPSVSGFRTGAFDGRYVYYVPFGGAGGKADGLVARYDTQSPFTTTTAWSIFDMTSVNAVAKGFRECRV